MGPQRLPEHINRWGRTIANLIPFLVDILWRKKKPFPVDLLTGECKLRMEQEPTITDSWGGPKKWMVSNRYVIYLVGLAFWVGLSIWLPTTVTATPVGRPQSPVVGAVEYLLEFLGGILLFMNLVSTFIRKGEDEKLDKKLASEKKDRFALTDEEVKRMDLIQDYGAKVILPASLATAFVAGRISALFSTYTVAAIAAGAFALVPIWVTGLDYRPLAILRHIKTVVVIWAAIWLVQAVATLL